LSVWHGTLHKKKPTGGKKRQYRKKRKFEKGSYPTETTQGETKKKLSRRHGKTQKNRLLTATHANISDPATGKTQKTEITRVIKNPANPDYDRRGVITKGALIETPLGTAKITSRPGQDGIVNATLIPKKPS